MLGATCRLAGALALERRAECGLGHALCMHDKQPGCACGMGGAMSVSNDMSTKEYAPWNLKPGMKLAPLRYAPGSEPNGDRSARYALGRIIAIRKIRGYFTGASAWHVTTDLGEKVMYHGRGRMLPAERVPVVIE